MKANIIFNYEEFGKAYDKAFKALFTPSMNPTGQAWFESEADADEWCGDIACDMVLDVLERLGIEVEDELGDI